MRWRASPLTQMTRCGDIDDAPAPEQSPCCQQARMREHVQPCAAPGNLRPRTRCPACAQCTHLIAPAAPRWTRQGKGMRTGADVLHWTGFDKTTIRRSTAAQVRAPGALVARLGATACCAAPHAAQAAACCSTCPGGAGRPPCRALDLTAHPLSPVRPLCPGAHPAGALLAGAQPAALADRPRLVQAGLERARRFTWAETARLTVEVYRRALA